MGRQVRWIAGMCMAALLLGMAASHVTVDDYQRHKIFVKWSE